MPGSSVSNSSVAPDKPASTLWECLGKSASNQTNAIALIHGKQEICYGVLASTVHSIAVALRSLNPTVGERIALVGNKTSEAVVALLAALHLRVTLVIINPLLKAPQIEHILNDSAATTWLCQPDKARQLIDEGLIPVSLKRVILLPANASDKHDTSEWVARGSITMDDGRDLPILHWNQLIKTYENSRLDGVDHPVSEELALILYTSGSTGKPKGVMLTHANLVNGAMSVSTYLGTCKEDRILALMPLSFDYGLSQLTSAVYKGATLVLYDYIVPRGVIDMATRQKITGIPAVPHLWDQLVKIDWPDMPHLRYITSTGARLQTKTIQALRDKLPDTELYSMYGFTEAFRTTFLPPSQLDQRPDSIGKPVPLANVLIVSSDGTELPAGQHGELIQSGPLVSLGYWNNPESTAVKFRRREVDDLSAGLYAWSGDIAFKDKDGYIYFVSRKDDLVKLNGYRVSPSEIESALVASPWISEACVLCVPDHRFGNVAIAFAVLDSPVELSELSAWCKARLPSFMVPAKWIILDSLPATPNNKLDRASLSAYLLNVS